MNIIRPACEAEVVSDFLKSEFHHREYHSDRDQWESLVLNADFANARDNQIRRHLLDRRHAQTWNELPDDTAWNVCELEITDLGRVHVSPNYHWPNADLGTGLTVAEIVSSIREARFDRESTHEVTAIQVIAYRMRQRPCALPVLLIGTDSAGPLTILDGNRTLIAAALAANSNQTAYRGYAGLSPRMAECYWYRNTPRNYVHHARSRMEAKHPWLFKGSRATWNLKAARWARLMLSGTRREFTHQVSR